MPLQKVYKATLFATPSVYNPSPNAAAALSDSPPPAPVPVLLKHRFAKGYRHPTLDALLTRQRLTSEARALVRCGKAGVCVPGLRIVDVKQGVLGIEWIEGWSVREVLGGGQEDDEGPEEEVGEDEEVEEESDDVAERLRLLGVQEDALLFAIGAEIAKMHLADVVHGDLTTSNMMVRLLPRGGSPEAHKLHRETGATVFEIVLIDFGLSSSASFPEDRAVDLYVLERAFASTHPVPLLASGEEGVPHFDRVLEGYKSTIEARAKKGEWGRIEKRLEDYSPLAMSRPSSSNVTPAGSRPHTPSGRPGTPSRLAQNPADSYIKNLGLLDPASQSRTNDLLGARNTEPIDDPPTEEELRRVAALAEKLNNKKKV
ncbi:hypothetical protein RQP46_011404 [Phenoliferia psychrophenolica]